MLCPPDRADILRAEMLAGTSSIGVRETAYRKYALPRAWFDVALGDLVVAVKVASRDGVIAQVSPEFDSVAAAAATLGAHQHDVLTAAPRRPRPRVWWPGRRCPKAAGAQ